MVLQRLQTRTTCESVVKLNVSGSPADPLVGSLKSAEFKYWLKEERGRVGCIGGLNIDSRSTSTSCPLNQRASTFTSLSG